MGIPCWGRQKKGPGVLERALGTRPRPRTLVKMPGG